MNDATLQNSTHCTGHDRCGNVGDVGVMKRKVDPDPKCKYCKGSGRVTLFTSIVDCDCVTNVVPLEIDDMDTKKLPIVRDGHDDFDDILNSHDIYDIFYGGGDDDDDYGIGTFVGSDGI